MEEVNNFFDFSKDFHRQKAKRGVISGNANALVKPSTSQKPKREALGQEYAKDLLQKEDELMEIGYSASETGMDDMDALSEIDEPGSTRRMDDIYEKYNFNTRHNEELPIYDSKEDILSMIDNHPVIVLEGSTGCGKTTQLPQYILDQAYSRREYCNIVCTQPRRIAAISIARRVCIERNYEEGKVVGYHVALHASKNEDTRLLYCTTGVLLQQLIKAKSLNKYTHIVLDEVHERNQEMDFLLIVIRRLLITNSRNVKIILMSATIDSKEFSNYFKIRRNSAPTISVDTRRLFDVSEFYLGDLFRINPVEVDIKLNEPAIGKEMYNIAAKLIIVLDNIERQVFAKQTTVAPIPYTSMLVFLPGIYEIDAMAKKLAQFDNKSVMLWPIRLHSLISPEEQILVFNRPPDNYRKIILTTNIAESSITVPDVKYVIDFCLTKSLVTDSSTNFTSLRLHWASHANCRQRAGRAGRVMNGRVYRLVPKHFYDNFMDKYSTPEMLRCPLENVVLKAKLLDMGPPPSILGLAMNPPNLSDITNTIMILKEVGALFTKVGGIYSVQDGDITFFGRVMAGMPLDIRLTRLIILGYMFSCLEDSIIIAAGLSVRSIFKWGGKPRELDGYIQKLIWADGSGSDLFAILKAYTVWAQMRENHNVREDVAEHSWANRYFINLRSIKEMHLLIKELTERLDRFGLKETHGYQRIRWLDREKTIVLKIIIAGAFYPNYFTRSTLNEVERERDVYHMLSGHDPCTTVYFSGFHTRYLGEMYSTQMKDVFNPVRIQHKNIEIRFQPGSERLFVTFKSDIDDEHDIHAGLNVQGRVRAEVYKAVRMRMAGIRPTLKVMDSRVAVKYAQDNHIGTMVDGDWHPRKPKIKNPELIILPNVFTKCIRGVITHIDNCSKFYFQPQTDLKRLREIQALLNDPDASDESNRFKNPADVSKDMLVSAPFEGHYHRAKVLKGYTVARKHVQFKVLFIDYGNIDSIEFEDLREIKVQRKYLTEMPPRIFECRLAMVHPSSMSSIYNRWSDKAMEKLQEIADEGSVELEIYSVVQSVVNVLVKMPEGTVNDMLVSICLARDADESYMSKMDHDYRDRMQVNATCFATDNLTKHNEEYLRSIMLDPVADEIEHPPSSVCTKTLTLSGPFSPLETNIFSAIRVGAWKCVNIERESVNFVLLDTDPGDSHERLVVAAGITENQSNDSLVARSTTLMPNIHGFGALMTMLFCPTMQIKANHNRTKYVAVLAGLGYDDETYDPLFEEHDIVLNLDVDMVSDDLELVNQLRYSMETMIFMDPGEERLTVNHQTRDNLRSKIKKLVIRLLNKNRAYIETHVSATDSVWERYGPDDVAKIDSIYGQRSIFPMHGALRLFDERFDKMHAQVLHCQEMHRLKLFDGPIQPFTCELCGHTLKNVVQLRIHLLSQLHRDRERQIGFKLVSLR